MEFVLLLRNANRRETRLNSTIAMWQSNNNNTGHDDDDVDDNNKIQKNTEREKKKETTRMPDALISKRAQKHILKIQCNGIMIFQKQ